MKRNANWVVLVLAASVFAALALGSSPGVASATSGEEAAIPCDPKLNLSEENACDPAWNLPEDPATFESIRVYAGERFAGTWIERPDERTAELHVGIVGASAEDDQAIQGIIGDRGRAVVQDARFTLGELEAVTEEVTNVFVAKNVEPYSVGAAQSAGRVVARVPLKLADALATSVEDVLRRSGSPEVESALAKVDSEGLRLSDLVEFTAGAQLVPADSRTTYPKHAGGRRLDLDEIGGSTNSVCTSAFTIVSSGGTYMGLTAGHCATGYLSDQVYIGNNYLSRSGKNSYVGHSSADSDSMRYSLASAADRDDNIFVNGTTIEYRDLQAPRYTMDDLVENVRLCFQGVTSNNDNCGDVQDVNVNTNPIGPGPNPLRHQFTIDFPCQGGDSGGPMYHVRDNGSAKAAGVVQGVDGNLCFFSQIGYALGDMDASLFYN